MYHDFDETNPRNQDSDEICLTHKHWRSIVEAENELWIPANKMSNKIISYTHTHTNTLTQNLPIILFNGIGQNDDGLSQMGCMSRKAKNRRRHLVHTEWKEQTKSVSYNYTLIKITLSLRTLRIPKRTHWNESKPM